MVELIFSVEGMKCGMCASHVNDVVRRAVKVKKVDSSLTKKQTVVIAEEGVDAEVIRAAIEGQGYTVSSVVSRPYVKRGLFRKS